MQLNLPSWVSGSVVAKGGQNSKSLINTVLHDTFPRESYALAADSVKQRHGIMLCQVFNQFIKLQSVLCL